MLSFLFDLESFVISLVGKIPAVFPTLTLRMPAGIELDDLVLEAFGILIVSFGSFAATNIASGLFKGFSGERSRFSYAGVYLLACVSHPSDALLGCIPGRDGFYKLPREPRARAVPGLAIYLVQSSLVFFNIDYVRDRIRWIVDRLPQSTRWFILDAEAVTTIDSTAAAVLGEISEEMSRRNLRFGVANLHARSHAIY